MDSEPKIFDRWTSNEGFELHSEPEYSSRYHWTLNCENSKSRIRDIPPRRCFVYFNDGKTIEVEDVNTREIYKVLKNVKFIHKKCW